MTVYIIYCVTKVCLTPGIYTFYQSQAIHSATLPPITVRESLQSWTQSRTAVWEMASHTMMVVDVECVTVSIYYSESIKLVLSFSVYNTDTIYNIYSVIGFSEETRALQLDEGEASTLTVQVLKPALGTPAAQLAIGFQIDNTANIGKSIFQQDMTIV